METALITGANQGLGEALAYTFKEAGYGLVLNSLVPIPEYDGQVVVGNLRSPITIANLSQTALAKGVSILINNAGVYANKPFQDMTPGEIEEVIDTNLIVPMMLIRTVWPSFWAMKGGLIVNINSLAGLNGTGGEAAYCASKHGLAGLSKALQFDGVKDNVRILNVYLGAMKTAITQHRPTYDKLMDPFEVAKSILGFCKDWKSLKITEVTLVRSAY